MMDLIAVGMVWVFPTIVIALVVWRVRANRSEE